MVVWSETVEQPAAARRDVEEPRIRALRASVARVWRELAAHPAELSDRQTAEEELAVLDTVARASRPEPALLRRSLLLVTAALGSVSALGPSLTELRQAIELFQD